MAIKLHRDKKLILKKRLGKEESSPTAANSHIINPHRENISHESSGQPSSHNIISVRRGSKTKEESNPTTA